MVCPHCGKKHPDGALFCPFTALPITDDAGLDQAIQAAPAARAAGVGLSQPVPSAQKKALPWAQIVLLGVGSLLLAAGCLVSVLPIIRSMTMAKPEPLPAVVVRFSPDDPWPNLVVEARESTAKPLATSAPEPTLVLPSPTVPALPPPSTPNPTPGLPTPGQINEKDQAPLVLVPTGPFVMGSEPDRDPYFWGAEGPPHNVTLKSYWIYQIEVTNAMYQTCVNEKACPLPQQKKSRTRLSYYNNPLFDDYPVIYVTWQSAAAYCTWAGGRLPTEAEWEKAARGDQDTRLFPWGDKPPLGSQANFCDDRCASEPDDREKQDGYEDTAPVGSYPAGASPYGALDMSGNVWEWVFDWFQPGYSKNDVEDPRGPASSKTRTIRGGSWYNPSAGLRIVQRDGVKPDNSLDTLGFRCVVDDK